MEPGLINTKLQDLAIFDPVAALGILLHVPRTPVAFNIPVEFSTFTVGQEVEASLDTTVNVRTWIDNIQYSLQCPQCFQNNIFKTQWDAYLRQQPGVSVSLQVVGGPKYIVSENPTPLETLCSQFASRWPHGWPLFRLQTIAATFLLTQAPGGADGSENAPPYDITLTFNGWQFLDTSLENVSPKEAADRLREIGFCIPNPEPIC